MYCSMKQRAHSLSSSVCRDPYFVASTRRVITCRLFFQSCTNCAILSLSVVVYSNTRFHDNLEVYRSITKVYGSIAVMAADILTRARRVSVTLSEKCWRHEYAQFSHRFSCFSLLLLSLSVAYMYVRSSEEVLWALKSYV